MGERWRVWDAEKGYGKVFYQRATGRLAEMESSKAAARIVARLIKKDQRILDAGCGGGHYLVSLDNILTQPFCYHGFDATKYYIGLAREAFACNRNRNPLRLSTVFSVGDVFDISLPDGYADVVMCNNVLLHLPSIEKPVKELWRVTKRFLVLRTLVGTTGFRIRQINHPEVYGKDGEPLHFHFFNIYSRDYVKRLVKSLPGVKGLRFIEDKDFKKSNIGAANYRSTRRPHDLTTIVNGMQVNNYIIQPWHFVIIEKRS